MANCRSVMQIDSFMWFWLSQNHEEALLSCQVLQWLPVDTNWMNQICRGWECITKIVLAKNYVGGQCSNCLSWITFSLVNSGTWKTKHMSLGEAWGSSRLFMNCKKKWFFLGRENIERRWILNILSHTFERTKLPCVYI